MKDGHGFLIEAPAFGPGFVAALTPWSSCLAHKEMMANVPFTSALIFFVSFVRDRGSGQVSLNDNGRPHVIYDLTEKLDQKHFREALGQVCRIHVAAGAAELRFSLSSHQLSWKRGEDLEEFIKLVQSHPVEGRAQPVISAHQMGRCRMGTDPASSVANTDGELHDIQGVWIADGSAFPSASGANPMISIMALALRTAEKIAERSRSQKSTMTSHVIELTAKSGKRDELIKAIKSKVFPFSRSFPGYIGNIILAVDNDENRALALSFWTERRHAEHYTQEGFPHSVKMVEHLVASPPDRRVTEIRFSSIQGIPTNDLEQRKSSGESQLDSFSDALESVSNNAVSLAKSLMQVWMLPLTILGR